MTPEQLASRACKLSNLPESSIVALHIIDALKEYGETVRKQAVSVCKELPRPLVQINTADQCAAAIEKMELP